MLFTIVAEDKPDTLEQRLAVREDHLLRLHELQNQQRLMTAGPVFNDEEMSKNIFGSLIIAEFESLEAAKLWASADPYLKAGVYGKITIKPYKKVF